MRPTSVGNQMRHRRLDGETYLLPKYSFFAVDARGGIHRGNAQHVTRSAAAKKYLRSGELKARFRSFEAKIKSNAKPADLDDEARKGLEALGYLQ